MTALEGLTSGVRGALRTTLGVPEGPRRLPRGPKVLRLLLRAHESNSRFALAALVPYLVLLIWMHVHHELWRDEIHPWILARQADGFWDLVTGDRRYDGHPPGWFWYLRPFTWLSRSPAGLQVATILLSLGSTFLLLRFAPFARPIRLLLAFSSLFAFEYGTISRNYTLGILFVFLFCSTLRPLRSRPLLLALCLAGAALSSVYGAIVAACLLLVLVAESCQVGRVPSAPSLLALRLEKRGVWAVVLVAGAILFSLWSIVPPDPNPYAPGLSLDGLSFVGAELSLARLTWSTLPLREVGDLGYLSAFDLAWGSDPVLLLNVSLLLFGTMVLVLAAFPVELLAFVLGAALMATVQLAVYPGSIRHWGHYLVLFLCLCWTARVRRPDRWGKLMPALLFVIGLTQSKALVVAVREETRWPFSTGGAAANYIQQAGLADLPVVGGPDYAMPTVMGYLDRNFISCETSEWNQTLVFHARRHPCTPTMLFNKAVGIALRTGEPVLLVTVFPLLDVPPPELSKVLLFQSTEPPVTDEDFKVYYLARVGTPVPAPSRGAR